MDQIEIAIGTYENLILGYKVQDKIGGGYSLETSFTTDSHRGALRCLAVSNNGVLASSSTDDSIRLHSLKKRREVGSLFQHDGSVNCIRFFKGGHMFSASEDGTICLWKCKNWELLRVFKGHRCHVMAVAVHPSAKLGLSVGADRMFFTWDMTTGKLAFKRKIDQVAQDILFTRDGMNYILIYQRKIEVCSLEDTNVVHKFEFNCRINAACFIEENILAIGIDDGSVVIVDVVSNTTLIKTTFKGRVRCLHSLSLKTELLLLVATSTGCIRVCKVDLTKDEEKLDPVIEFESGARVTCMAAYAPFELLKESEELLSKSGKRNRKRKAFNEEVEGGDLEAIEGVEDEKKLQLDLSESDDDNVVSAEEEGGKDNEEEDGEDVDEEEEEEEMDLEEKLIKKKRKSISNDSPKRASKKQKLQKIDHSAKKQKKSKDDSVQPKKKKKKVK